MYKILHYIYINQKYNAHVLQVNNKNHNLKDKFFIKLNWVHFSFNFGEVVCKVPPRMCLPNKVNC